ncbi:GTP-binding protein, partial [Acidithiobacillus ferrivorans]|nr:GTP-binding protein [Acidithiobacillus ferrivorans]
VSGHEVEIGTANFDWSAFHKNREYLNVTGNTAIVKAAQRVFDADWNDQKAGPYPHQVLVLSPGSAAQMVSVIDQPGPVDIESEEMGD